MFKEQLDTALFHFDLSTLGAVEAENGWRLGRGTVNLLEGSCWRSSESGRMVLFRFDVSTLALTSKPPNRPESMRDPPERGGHHCVLNELGDWAGRREKIVKRRFRRWQMGVGQWWMARSRQG